MFSFFLKLTPLHGKARLRQGLKSFDVVVVFTNMLTLLLFLLVVGFFNDVWFSRNACDSACPEHRASDT